MRSMIFIDTVSALYGKTNVLTDFSLEITEGGIYALIGPSGCGKSTLIKILCRIHTDFTGNIFYKGKDFFKQKLTIGYVPQNYGLLDWKTVEENIYLPFKLNKDISYNPKEVSEILRILEIGDILNRYPLQLSGGQRQRVALARAFLIKPDLLLMDEPFSSLDSFTSKRSQELFLRLWDKYNITSIVITHNIFEAVNVGRYILLMDKSTGKIRQQIENNTFGENNNIAKIELADEISESFKISLDV